MAGAHAQSLGEPAAELWIGRPLEVTIPARFASADSRDTCVHAEVFYGETRLASSQVRTTLLGTEDDRRVRITTDVVVDEPLVTVSLRAGCTGTFTRNYTLLPDMPSEAVLARLMQPVPVALAMGAPALAAPNSVLATRVAARGLVARTMPATARAPAAPRQRTASAFRPAVRMPAARLRLEAIEADASALLRVSANLSQPAGDAAQRATAAVLWQALSATPDDIVRSSAALQKLETELAYLRLAAGQNRAEMAALRQRIDEARPWYVKSPRTAQVLALLVILASASAALLAWRARRQTDDAPAWYALGGAAPVAGGQEAVAQSPQPEPKAQPSALESADASGLPASSHFADLAESEAQPAGRHAAVRSPSGLLRVETLAATLEEVDFLASLGLHSDAMEVLKAYLEDSASPAPVAFLELMRVCSLADDPQAVEAVRRRYAKVFGQPAPSLEQLTDPAGLEAQPALNAQVIARWGGGEVLPVIEQALFDKPAGEPPITLQTARDLICLYDVAMLVAAEGQAALAPGQPQEQALAPWADAEHAHEAQAVAQAVADDSSGHRFALDIDVTVAPQPLPDKPSQPDAQELAARLVAEKEARQAAARAAAEAEDAFSAAVAFERAPVSRF